MRNVDFTASSVFFANYYLKNPNENFTITIDNLELMLKGNYSTFSVDLEDANDLKLKLLTLISKALITAFTFVKAIKAYPSNFIGPLTNQPEEVLKVIGPVNVIIYTNVPSMDMSNLEGLFVIFCENPRLVRDSRTCKSFPLRMLDSTRKINFHGIWFSWMEYGISEGVSLTGRESPTKGRFSPEYNYKFEYIDRRLETVVNSRNGAFSMRYDHSSLIRPRFCVLIDEFNNTYIMNNFLRPSHITIPLNQSTNSELWMLTTTGLITWAILWEKMSWRKFRVASIYGWISWLKKSETTTKKQLKSWRRWKSRLMNLRGKLETKRRR